MHAFVSTGPLGTFYSSQGLVFDAINELRALIEREQLYGLGCGLVDIALLASTLTTPDARLWTLDKRLTDLALCFSVSF